MAKQYDFRNGSPVEPREQKNDEEDSPTFRLELTDKKVDPEELGIELRKAREEEKEEMEDGE